MDHDAFFEWQDGAKGPPLQEHKLMVAMVEDAIDCLLYKDRPQDSDKRREKKKRERDDAYAWITAQDVRDHVGRPWLFSFESVCEHLGLDGKAMRKGIMDKYNASLGSV